MEFFNMSGLKLNDHVIKGISKLIQRGMYANRACAVVGINEVTLYRWMKQAQDDIDKGIEDTLYCRLMQAVKQAEAHHQSRLLKKWDRVIEGIDPDNQTGKTWVAIPTMLERRYPREFGRHISIKHTDEEAKAVEVQKEYISELKAAGYLAGGKAGSLPDPDMKLLPA